MVPPPETFSDGIEARTAAVEWMRSSMVDPFVSTPTALVHRQPLRPSVENRDHMKPDGAPVLEWTVTPDGVMLGDNGRIMPLPSPFDTPNHVG